MEPGILNVLERPALDFGLLIVPQLPDDAGRRSDHKRPRRDSCSRSHERIRADNRARADFRAIENDGAHSNQHFIIEGAGVDDR